MEDILIPITVCCVLPITIVWLVNRTRQNETNRKTEIMLKAIEAGATIDTNFFKSQQKRNRTIKERLLRHLTGGCIFTLMGVAMLVCGLINRNILIAQNLSLDSFIVPVIFSGLFFAIGLSLLIVFFAGRKMHAKEIEIEEKALEEE